MNKLNNLLKIAILPALLLTFTSCDKDGPNESYNFVKEVDEFGLLPEDVTNANLDIDFLVYIEGQQGVIPDIGNYSPILDENGNPVTANGEPRKYGPKHLTSVEMAPYFAAASEFKKYAPDVRINLIYCSIGEYNTRIQAYNEQYHHLPHIMWATDHVVEMMERGMATDLSEYSDSEYYSSYNEYCMTRFRFGDFQAGFPIAAEPWGVFVNTKDLVNPDYAILNSVYDSDGRNSSEYKDWVDNFTWESMMSAMKATTTDTHAGVDKVVDYFMSYSLDTINSQFIYNGSVDLTSDKVSGTVSKLLEYENKITEYSAYKYDETSVGNQPNKEKFAELATWNGTKNFVENQYYTFTASAPWSLRDYSQYINEHNLNDSITIDYLPYPKVDSSSNTFTGIAVEGLTIGNQCPVGTDGEKHCYRSTSKLEQDVAAYFAMFFGCDSRAIRARSEVKYIFDGTEYTGSLSLPIIKRDFLFSWQEDPAFDDLNPAIDYDDNWQYQMALWFDIYNIYVNDDQPADVENFENIAYGLTKVLDSVYCIDNDYVTTLNFWNEPVNVWEGDTYRDIFDNWQLRYTKYVDRADPAAGGYLGSPTYVAKVLANIAEIEQDINSNSEKVWLDLNFNVELYYGEGVYDVTDRTHRNNYEGSLFN